MGLLEQTSWKSLTLPTCWLRMGDLKETMGHRGAVVAWACDPATSHFGDVFGGIHLVLI